MKIEGSDIERILLSLRYAISKLKEEGATPHIEINKFNQLYDRISDGIINESKIDQSHDGIGEGYAGGVKASCENCDD